MEWTYWRIGCKYGHVGTRKEISVARHLVLPAGATLLDAIDVAKDMPGVKHRGIFSGKRITREQYLEGNRTETENFYLQRLRTFRKKAL